MKFFSIVLGILVFGLMVLNSGAGQVYTWTDKNGNLHITDTPPPKNGTLKEVTPYREQTDQEIQETQQLQQEKQAARLKKEEQEQQIEEARRRAREADARAKQAVENAQKITSENDAYIRRLGSTQEKRKKFGKRIQRLKEQTEAAQADARQAVEQARQAEEESRKIEEQVKAGQNQ